MRSEADEQTRADHTESGAQRGELQRRLSDWLDLPLTILAFVMLGLLVLELVGDLSPTWAARVSQTQTAIWAAFVAVFLVELALAPSKRAYLRNNWLTAVSVALPALRSIRVLRAARALRGLSLVRILTTVNRGSRALGNIVQRGRFDYVLALTGVVTVTSGAGAYYFERTEPSANIRTPGDAFWWAATIVTTVNSPYETITLEGRVIALLLRVFGLAISGYLTAIIAAYLIGAKESAPEASGATADALRELRLQVARLQNVIEQRASEDSPERRADGTPPGHWRTRSVGRHPRRRGSLGGEHRGRQQG